MDERIRQILQELKAEMQARYGDRFSRMLLYGSCARGDAEPDSDIDVLVVLKGEVDTRKEMNAVFDVVYKFCYEYDTVIQYIVVSERKFQEQMNPLLMNIQREGQIV